MKRFFKILRYFILSLIVIFGLIYIFISPIAKYIIQKNSMKWLGRQITIDALKVNAFNGSVYIKNVHISEADTTKVFFECHDVYVKMRLMKLLGKVFDIEEARLDEPEITVVQDGNKFNFDDLSKRFASKRTEGDTNLREPASHFYIHNIKLVNGNITYNNKTVNNVFRIHNINFNCPEFAWNTVMANLHLDFKYGIGGDFNVDAGINRKTLEYNVGLSIDKYDLSQYYAPLNAYMKISSIAGSLTTKLRLHGKINSPKEFAMWGYLHINDVDVRDTAKKKLFAMGELLISVDTINVKHGQYIFHNILMDKPYMVFNYYQNGSNLSHLFKHQQPKEETKEEAKGEPKDTAKGKKKADYTNLFTFISSNIKNMAADYLNASYHADSIAIRNGEFIFNDNTADNKFHYTVSKITLVTNEVGAKNKSVNFTVSASLNDTGKFNLNAGIHYDFRKKKLDYKITTLGISHISPIAKYIIEKYDTALIGRQVTISHIKINAMNGSVNIKDIKVYEAHSDSVFFACHDFYVKLNLDKLFTGVYGIDTILIDQPQIRITQNGNTFNFDDLKKRFSSRDTTKKQDTNAAPIQYSIQNVIINNGNITYTNVPIHNVASIHNINFKLPDISWNKPQSQLHLDFKYGKGGTFNIDLDANLKTLDYHVALNIVDYDLSQYYAPLTKFISMSSLQGVLNTNLNIYGNFNNPKDISSVGFIRVTDFEVRDTANSKVFAMGKLLIDIDTINVKHNLYSINNILLDKPFIRFDYYTNGNNISQMIKYTSAPGPVTDTAGQVKADFSNIFTLLSSSIKLMAVDFFNTNYHTDSITIHHGQLLYNDYTLNTPFHYNISNINLATDEISAKSKNIVFKAKARLNDTGRFTMTADISLDLKNMLFTYNVTNLRIADLNPYMEYYMATPFLGGYVNYQSTDSIINRYLKSTNLIHIEGLEVGKKTDDKPVYNVPVRTAVALLKDEKGNIDINLPANGNLDDPNYKVGKIVWPMISDLLKKSVESPFKLLAKTFKKDPEALKELNFDYMQEELAEKEVRKLDDIYTVLKKKKELNVEIIQVIDSMEEKAELALSLAKKQYFDETKRTVSDSLLSRHKKKKEGVTIDRIATHDTLFDKYLDDKLHLTGNELITIEAKCIQLVGDDLLNKQIHQLIESRNKQVTEFLINKKSLSPERVKVVVNKDSLFLANFPEPVFYIKYSAQE